MKINILESDFDLFLYSLIAFFEYQNDLKIEIIEKI
jgi:hypothetical protein